MCECAKAKEGKKGKKHNKIYVYQERWLKFRGEHNNARDILNFIAERIKLFGALKMEIVFSGL